MIERIAGLALGYAADRLFGDPRHYHPVAGFGRWATGCERRMYARSRVAGTAYLVTTVGPYVLIAGAAARASKVGAGVTALATWAALGGRSLEREAAAVHDLLDADDLPAARLRVRSLVGRDTQDLDADSLARAVVESLAENQSDAVAGSLVWGAIAGAPGIVLHRCVNTLDAMVGHRTERYYEFGWSAARLDDVLNWLPARISVLATSALVMPAGRAHAVEVLTTAMRDGAQHPSPNAGRVEAAAAAALGVRLGGPTTYGGRVEDRGRLGDGRQIRVSDIPRAVSLTRRLGSVVLGGVCLVALMPWRHKDIRLVARRA